MSAALSPSLASIAFRPGELVDSRLVWAVVMPAPPDEKLPKRKAAGRRYGEIKELARRFLAGEFGRDPVVDVAERERVHYQSLYKALNSLGYDPGRSRKRRAA